MTQPYAELGAALKRARIGAGLSLRTLARRLGMTAHSGLVDYETGRRLLPEDLLDRYEKVFGGGELRRLRDAALAARAGRTAGPAPTPVRPAQLPADLPDFVGRAADLEQLFTAANDVQDAHAPTVLVVSGPPGVGKTSLAVHLGHLLASRHPDGQLYVELRGTDDRPADPAAVLRQLLRGLGAGDGPRVADVAELAAWYRSLLAGRRLLLLLDDAHSEAQVRPLLPGGPGTLVIVTSRNPLAGLDGHRPHHLDTMSTAETVWLLARIVGSDRVRCDAAAARRIAESCGGFPLAARLAAARLAVWPRWSLAECADTLADGHRRLAWLASGDRAVRGAFELSYRSLPAPAARLFRLLALLPVPQWTTTAACVLTSAGDSDAEAQLDALVAVGLVQPAPEPGRYRMHDLTMLYARDRLEAEEPPESRDRTERQLLAWLLGTAHEAATLLDSSADEPPRTAAFASTGTAIRWLDAERAAVSAAVRRAAELDLAGLVHPLASVLPWYYDLRCLWEDQRTLAESALDLATRHGDGVEQVVALNGLALATMRQPAEAARHCARAIRVARGIGAAVDEAWAWHRLGMTLAARQRHATAAKVHHRAAELAHACGQAWLEAGSLNHVGLALGRAGEHARAIDAYRQGLRMFVARGQPRGEAMARVGLGTVLAATGRFAEAADHHRAALELFAAADDGWGRAHAQYGLGVALRGLGAATAATDLLTEAAAGFARHGDHDRHAEVLRALANPEPAPTVH